MRRVMGVVGVMVAGTVAACGTPQPAPSRMLVVREAWARAADSGATGAIYFSATNTDTMPLSIAAMSSPVSVAAELHETMQMDGMAHMTPRPAVQLARDSTLTLAPGGLHIMLIELHRALRAGDSVPLTITLLDGRTVSVTAVVRAP